MDIKPENLISLLQQHKPLPQAQVLLLCGEEDYYRNSIIAALPEYVFGDTPEADREITVFDKDTNLSGLQAAVNSYPFFCGKSLIFLKDEKLWAAKPAKANSAADAQNDTDSKKMEQLAAIVSDVPDYCLLVISSKKMDKRTKLYKQLKASALICPCERIKERELDDWLYAQAALYGAHFTRDALAAISEYIEPVKEEIPLDLLQQEIGKLAIYAAGRREWTEDDVLNVFALLPNASSFALTNYIMAGKLKQCLELLASERKHGTYILPLSATVAFKLRQVLRYLELKRRGYDQKGIMEELGMRSPYAYRFLERDSRRFDEKRLTEALLGRSDMNIKLRQGGRGYEKLEEILVRLLA